MDFTAIIDRQRAALVRLVAMLFVASGLVPGQAATLPRIIRGAVLHTLRPAEAATLRLIVVLAEGLAVTLRARRSALSQPIPLGNGERVPAFALSDPRKRFATSKGRKFAHGPRLSFFDGFDPAVEPQVEKGTVLPDGPVDAARLLRRMEALKRALDNLPREARRLARRQLKAHSSGKIAKAPMRPGRPPGYRKRGRYEIDEILHECHQIALMARAAPNTS